MAKKGLTSLLKIMPLILLSVVFVAMPAFTDVAMADCSPASTYYQNHLGDCWSCTLFDTMFTAINDYASATYKRLAKPCVTLMAIFAAIYLAVFVMRYISAFNEQRPAEFLTKLFGFLLRVMFIGVLLAAGAGTFSSLVVSPIILTTTELSTAILDSFTQIKSEIITDEMQSTSAISRTRVKVCDDTGCKTQTLDGTTTFTPVYCEKMREAVETEDIHTDDQDSKILDGQIHNALLCMINNMHYEVAYSVSLGDAMMCYSWTANTGWFGFRYPSLEMLLTGLIIWAVSMMISVAYVFKLIDGIFRIGVLMVLLPLLAVAWVFPPTVEFAKKGFSMLIHVMMMFISLSLILGIVIMLIMVAFTQDNSDTSLYQLFNENRIYDMKNILSFFSMNFFFGVISLFIAFKLLDIADHIAMEFSGVDVGTSVGDKLSMTFARTGAALGRSALTAGRMVAGAASVPIAGKFAATKLGSRVAATQHKFHNFFTDLNQRAQQRFGFSGLESSISNLDDHQKKIMDLAGTYKLDRTERGVAGAKELAQLQDKLDKKEITDPKERAKAEKQIEKLKNNEEVKQFLKADGSVDMKKVASDDAACVGARLLESIHGREHLRNLSLEQKARLIDGKDEVSETENMKKVDNSNYQSLLNVQANEFRRIKSDAELAEKIRKGEATEEEKEEAKRRAVEQGDQDMINLLVMKDKDFAEQRALINNTAELADNIYERSQKIEKDLQQMFSYHKLQEFKVSGVVAKDRVDKLNETINELEKVLKKNYGDRFKDRSFVESEIQRHEAFKKQFDGSGWNFTNAMTDRMKEEFRKSP